MTYSMQQSWESKDVQERTSVANGKDNKKLYGSTDVKQTYKAVVRPPDYYSLGLYFIIVFITELNELEMVAKMIKKIEM